MKYKCLITYLDSSSHTGNTENLTKGFEGSTTSPTNLALAFFSGLWAFDGWWVPEK
jgi:hypothetical protein